MMDGVTEVQMTQGGLKTEFLAFELPPTQSSIENTREIEYSPLAALNPGADGQVIEFHIPGSAEEFIDLDSVFLKIKFNYVGWKQTTVVAGAESKPNVLAENDEISVVNNLLHSMFEKVELSVQSTVVNPHSSMYPYRAYIENLLGYSEEAKKTYLALAGWDMEDNDSPSQPIQRRRETYQTNKDNVLYGMLHLDLGGQDKLILNGASIRLNLTMAPTKFFLHAKAGVVDIKCDIKDIKLYVTKKKATTAQMQVTERSLASKPACYPVRRIEMKEQVLATGTTSVSLDNLYSGTLPARIIMCLVDNAAVRGDFTKNPFNFEHNNLNYTCCFVNGDPVPRVPYRPSFVTGAQSYEREYVSLYHNVGKMNPHPFCDLTKKAFGKGSTIFCFNLTADGSDSGAGHFNPIRRGVARLDLSFATPLTKTVSVILFAEYDSVITIDRHRNVQIAF